MKTIYEWLFSDMDDLIDCDFEKSTGMEWIKVKEKLPPEKVIVETKIDDENGCRNEQKLYRYKNRWFLEDGRMYVYYTPTHWRYCKRKRDRRYDPAVE